jgi:hypothetical protein
MVHISERHVGSSLITRSATFFDQFIAKPTESKSVPIVAEARPGYDGKRPFPTSSAHRRRIGGSRCKSSRWSIHPSVSVFRVHTGPTGDGAKLPISWPTLIFWRRSSERCRRTIPRLPLVAMTAGTRWSAFGCWIWQGEPEPPRARSRDTHPQCHGLIVDQCRGLTVDRQSELHGDAWPGVRGGPYASPVSFDNRTADR